MTLLARLLSPAVAALAVWLAYRAGGGGEPRAPLPRPPSLPSSVARESEATAHPAEGGGARAPGDATYEVTLRLVEAMSDARYDAPNLRAAQAAFGAHWRKMQTPWTGLAGDAARLVTSVAFTTSASEEQHLVPTSTGKVWAPDARIWNMNEGSFDQRDAIFAPTPATVAFRVTLPMGARFDFAMGTVNALGDGAQFAVSVVDAGGAEHDVFRRHVVATEAKRWLDASVDLSRYGGQSVELRLKTTPAIDAPAPLLALWANPTILARREVAPTAGASPAPPGTRLPYNVLWIVVDALRPDVIPSFHDDAEDKAARASRFPPLEALLPRVPGLTPAIDAIAARGVRFTHAYSAGAWTRPGTLAMLAGARSSELGVGSLDWRLRDVDVNHFYASAPPLLPLLLRKQGAVTRAFVNNYFMVGYATVGVDLGFERVDDHRYRTRDTLEITTHAIDWLNANKDERFFLFCNYDSPHEPWDPPDRFKARIPPPPAGPADGITRLYMAEAAKDDEAIGMLMSTLDALGLRERTLVVVTADHGETLSSAHSGTALLDKMEVRYHHAVSNYEETSRVPIVLSLPGVLPEGAKVAARVRNTDLAPSVLELEGLEANAKMSGRSLMPLVRGETESDERVVVTEGRGTRAILAGRYRLLVREGPAQTTIRGDKPVVAAEELYDLKTDPGERNDLAHTRPDLVLEMRARLEAARKNVPVAGTQASVAPPREDAQSLLSLRFAGGGGTHRVSGTIFVGDPKVPGSGRATEVLAIGLPADAFKPGERVDLALVTPKDGVVGLDLRVEPPGAPVRWELFLDDAPWPAALVYGGPFGLAAPELRAGVTTEEARASAHAARVPDIDPHRDLGLFVARERGGEGEPTAYDRGDQSHEEMARLLRDWGYANKPSTPKR